MYRKLILNDIKNSKLMTAAITAFIFTAALLASLAAILSVNLFSAIDTMLSRAQTPHFLQMHSGVVNENRLADFAKAHTNVDSYQVLELLNVNGDEIQIGDHTLAKSVQDNGLSVQSDSFDFLLDLNGDRIVPSDGEIYVPLYYMKEGQAALGDVVFIHGHRFTVAGFLRDSQMNAALISSKRFLVNPTDFEKIRAFGSLEYLIEFRLKDLSALSVFEAEYIEAGLEANGPPAITYPLFKVANAISDGLMIAVLMLIGVLVILVTFLCIRLTLLAKTQEDYREIGVLKAIGLRVSSIKKIYLAKYGAMAAIACLLGFGASLIAQNPLSQNIRLYMGESDQPLLSALAGALCAAAIFGVVLLYVNGVLSLFRKISPAQAIRFGAPKEKSTSAKKFRLSENRFFSPNVFLGIKDVLTHKKLYMTMLFVLIIASFILTVPQNIFNTISSRHFMTYMGIGSCTMRLDIQQTDHISEKTQEIAKFMESDAAVAKSVVLTSYMFDLNMEDGSTQHLKVELGDPTVFPIEYASGHAPAFNTEIALSVLTADDLEKKIGDSIVLMVDGAEKQLTVCGIYSDITNGGKTAKAIFETDEPNILWSIVALELVDPALVNTKVSEYKEKFSFAKVSNIDDYKNQTFGSTISAIGKASIASAFVAALLTLLVTLLFMKMLVTKDRGAIAILKSLGFTNTDIIRQYTTRALFVLFFGVVIGAVLSNTLGEVVGAALISSFGASSFRFEVNPLFAYLFAPLLIAVCVYIAALLGVSDIRLIKISDHIKE